MNVDALADLLRNRGCEAVYYFHTDHFEPWSDNIDDKSARAIDRMAAMARASPYAQRLSLFYNVFVPYRLETDDASAYGNVGVPGDQVVFFARSPRQEELAREAIRPLVTADRHEIHLHVHHEYWTCNTSHFDTPVSRWVNACSSPELDRARLDLNLKLCKETIAREVGIPFERWAFIHGNWALNASDPLICHVSDEMALIMRHGGFGDFSFPAGRSYCDPKLETPFTCLPLDLPRAYDDPHADPRAVGPDTKVMSSDRFFIWNSPIKSLHSSLDYYSAANRALFKQPERLVATWLSKSVRLGGRLFIKTHAHSMKSDYKLAEPDSLIPHCYPDVVAVFECLARACDRAGVELKFVTINEVMDALHELDGAPLEAGGSEDVADVRVPPPATLEEAEDRPAQSSPSVAAELAALHREWMKIQAKAGHSPDALYSAKLSGGGPLEAYELALAQAMLERYPQDVTRVIEIGSGWGGLAILLARLGYEVLCFEGNVSRHTGCQWHFAEQIRRFPTLQERLVLSRVGLFPAVFDASMLAGDKLNLCIATNITSSYSAEQQPQMVRAAAWCDELILDLARFGQTRDQQSERDILLQLLRWTEFEPIEQLYFDEPYEYWRLRSHTARTTSVRPWASAVATVSAFPPSPTPAIPALLEARRNPLFSVFGDRHLHLCPVCRSSDIAPLWRMPATTLAEPIKLFGGYFNQIPTLQVPGTLFCFDFCHSCESIFLNPVAGDEKHVYRATDHYIRKMQTASEWRDYEDVYDSFAAWIPPEATVMIDAACGIGQYLHVARQRGTHRWKRLIGLELAEKYVAHMQREGFDAHLLDLDTDDLRPIAPPDSVDFITFSEAFEHVERPLEALAKLVEALRPGGRLYFTAQRYGRDVQSAVRPGEPIYIGEKVVDEITKRIGCRIVEKTTSNTRYHLVLEK
jgi:SAM-dependent methyltransferase